MKTITLTHNTPAVFHVRELPPLKEMALGFGFNPGKMGEDAAIRINISLSVNGENGIRIIVCTHDSMYKMEGEGLVIEDNIFDCCLNSISLMKMFLKFHQLGRLLLQELNSLALPSKDSFGEDLIDVAKALNAIEGKRGFPQ
ncbi:hypothetical protein SAMN05444410_10695 [Hydrobacter penzbergensis]|uniref:Uncharacterized protein n=1 Tax=Hydrobacter penzbergensis TaxID=1235997 RepID=A0A8X8IFT0_9BACT|nr:hypothetical protein [Hydrobacter penzbergensis]SDW83857.1 hypothetical protein SAMN05444410_10695 [Hydrobacter penzbergensis]